MENLDELCKGCYAYKGCDFRRIPRLHVKCPCRTCLLKGICLNVCPEYEKLEIILFSHTRIFKFKQKYKLEQIQNE